MYSQRIQKYQNAQSGYDKGIYTDSQVLRAKADYLRSL